MLKVNIVGIGPGNSELLTVAAKNAIDRSTVIIGDKRMLSFYSSNKKVYTTINSEEILEILHKLDSSKDEVSILVSGDIGFFSLGQLLANKLNEFTVKKYAGISSLVYFAQVLGISWSDVKLMSMHGRNNDFVTAVLENQKVFTLTGGDNNVKKLCQTLVDKDLENVKVCVGENLSYPEEKITEGTAGEIALGEFPALAVMFVLNEKAKKPCEIYHGLEDEEFTRLEKVPMTKSEVRAIITSKMKIKSTDIVYDIGAGTGSCSVEFALHAYRGKVYAFEINEEALKAIKINKEKFDLTNLEIVAGNAAETIKAIKVPDAAFIGGSSGKLFSLLDTIYDKNQACKVVISAITLETLGEITEYYKTMKDYSLDIVNVSVAKAKKLGNYHLMMAQNPIYIASIRKIEE